MFSNCGRKIGAGGIKFCPNAKESSALVNNLNVILAWAYQLYYLNKTLTIRNLKRLEAEVGK